jgi:uncharacterized membrane protein YhaH (DUF805 family)
MKRFWLRAVWFAVAIGTIAPLPSALAQQWAGLQNSMISITYDPPGDPGNIATYEFLKRRQVLEELSAFLAPVRLPKQLQIRMLECGVINSFYSPREGVLSLCYELPAYFSRVARAIEPADESMRQHVIVGAFVQVALHEVGHAVFDMLQVPIFGREEDAADQIAAFVMLNFGKDFASRALTGSAEMWRAMDAPLSHTAFADEHGTALQRYYNLLCITYGGQPDTFKDLVETGVLPKERASRCGREYEQVKFAFTQTVWPHVDQDLLKKVQAVDWAKWTAPSIMDEVSLALRAITGSKYLVYLIVAFFVASIASASPKDLIRQLTTFNLKGFRGRLSRRRWWTYTMAATSAALAINFILALLNGFYLPLFLHAVLDSLSYLTLALWLYWLMLFSVKRLHDTNMRGWWATLLIAPWFAFWVAWILITSESAIPSQLQYLAVLLFFASCISWLWVFLVLGFLRGTQGENRYGFPESA